MADRQSGSRTMAIFRDNSGVGSALLRWIQEHAPTSSQVVGFFSLVISAAILLILAGLTVSGATLGLIVFGPLLLITSPVWVPVGAVAFVLLAGAASAVGAAVAAAAVATWLYRYFTGRHPVGSDRIDFARSRIVDTASHVKDYAREYGGYLQSRIKDAAPGA
ncbi:oleosin 1-like [Dendrobium catenatum]|uniref:Oleosin 16 kDa n=1 Tax=Dendrobium catenatum TaxID=906689 RepID=A0A2I0WUU3_9ASPA|nr:oleosin 1-like [Dendrobium catenatum]PKU79432.1 Oleosin 16 kDa [Dendrobium catenatum]